MLYQGASVGVLFMHPHGELCVTFPPFRLKPKNDCLLLGTLGGLIDCFLARQDTDSKPCRSFCLVSSDE